jgi:hypothetical protein
MAYAYPVDTMDYDDAAAFNLVHGVHGCVSAVSLPGGGFGLALTGGGMDLSWQICDAFVAAGYLPPFHFCRGLPTMAGYVPAPVTIAAIRRTLEIQAQRASVARRDFDRRFPVGE